MSNLINSWKQLAQNVDSFFSARASTLACSKGCSKCCETPRSVFGVEAEVIAQHIESLSPEDLAQLKTRLSVIQEKKLNHCAFLDEGNCLIYLARPLICRSHGLVHLTKEGHHHCELNYTNGVPPKNDWIDEDRLNTLLALLEKEYEKQARFSVRVNLRDIALAII